MTRKTPFHPCQRDKPHKHWRYAARITLPARMTCVPTFSRKTGSGERDSAQALFITSFGIVAGVDLQRQHYGVNCMGFKKRGKHEWQLWLLLFLFAHQFLQAAEIRCKNLCPGMVRTVDLLCDSECTPGVLQRPHEVPLSLQNLSDVVGISGHGGMVRGRTPARQSSTHAGCTPAPPPGPLDPAKFARCCWHNRPQWDGRDRAPPRQS